MVSSQQQAHISDGVPAIEWDSKDPRIDVRRRGISESHHSVGIRKPTYRCGERQKCAQDGKGGTDNEDLPHEPADLDICTKNPHYVAYPDLPLAPESALMCASSDFTLI